MASPTTSLSNCVSSLLARCNSDPESISLQIHKDQFGPAMAKPLHGSNWLVDEQFSHRVNSFTKSLTMVANDELTEQPHSDKLNTQNYQKGS
jgi:hypothetical protein